MFLARHRRNHSSPAPPAAAPLIWIALAGLALLWRPAAAMPGPLYDGAAGGTPDTQSMIYLATGEGFLTPPVAAAQRYAAGLTILKTDAHQGDFAGYSPAEGAAPALDRTLGFTLTFTIRVVNQVNASPDRAGFSVLLLAQDLRGIELGFWEDQIWAQDDDPLFRRAESLSTDTTRLLTYDLAVQGDSYRLRGGGAELAGALRSYQASPFPVYHRPNMVFLGDNSSRGGAEVQLSRVALSVVPPAAPTRTSTPSATATATATASVTATEQPSATATATASSTLTASATAIWTSTPTATGQPSATATEQPSTTAIWTSTPTATERPSATATEQPSATATNVPTATPTASRAVDATYTLALPLLAAECTIPRCGGEWGLQR